MGYPVLSTQFRVKICIFVKKQITMGNILLFFSGGEIMVVVFFVLLFFGADAIPGLARTIGKGMREFNKATADLKNEFESHTADIKQDLTNLTDKLEKGPSVTKRKIDDELKE